MSTEARKNGLVVSNLIDKSRRVLTFGSEIGLKSIGRPMDLDEKKENQMDDNIYRYNLGIDAPMFLNPLIDEMVGPENTMHQREPGNIIGGLIVDLLNMGGTVFTGVSVGIATKDISSGILAGAGAKLSLNALTHLGIASFHEARKDWNLDIKK